MKRLISILMVLSAIVGLFVGCGKKGNYAEYPFVNIRWTRSAESDTEFIYFSSNGEFSYYCACGNPVNNSDLCEGFSYNPKTKTIKLKYAEKTKETITKLVVESVSDEKLVLDFDGEVRTFFKESQKTQAESIIYEGKKYFLIQYNSDIFNYDLTSDIEYEEDEIYPIEKAKWDTVYYNGDLFIVETDVEKASRYYSDDQNYNWWVKIEEPNSDSEYTANLTLSYAEREYIYNMENMDKNKTIFFEDIKKFATLAKTSNDGLITATTELVWCDDSWYWRSEIIDEDVEGWPEYIFKLPQTLNDRIITAEKSN